MNDPLDFSGLELGHSGRGRPQSAKDLREVKVSKWCNVALG